MEWNEAIHWWEDFNGTRTAQILGHIWRFVEFSTVRVLSTRSPPAGRVWALHAPPVVGNNCSALGAPFRALRIPGLEIFVHGPATLSFVQIDHKVGMPDSVDHFLEFSKRRRRKEFLRIFPLEDQIAIRFVAQFFRFHTSNSNGKNQLETGNLSPSGGGTLNV